MWGESHRVGREQWKGHSAWLAVYFLLSIIHPNLWPATKVLQNGLVSSPYGYVLSICSRGCSVFQWNTPVGEITRTPLGSYSYNKFKIGALRDFLTTRRWPRSSSINSRTASSLAQNFHRKVPLHYHCNFRGEGVEWLSSCFVSSLTWHIVPCMLLNKTYQTFYSSVFNWAK